MSVHVVCPEPDGDRILARLARTLCAETAWTLSDSPNPRASVNIFIPYLTLPQGWDGSKSAVWHTHPDPTIRGKGEMWNRIAASVALRTCSARQYLPVLQRFGPTALVTPPLDRDRFTPPSAFAHTLSMSPSLPRIGISGWNYPGGRKGPKLAAELMDAWPDGIRAHLTAIGEGWTGWPSKRISDRELPDWYRSLDVYVSTSLVEGVGYGPLEALSCGTPVVIPIGVGIFDDLPETEGIARYPVGDVRGMLSAVERALAAPADQDALRSATEPYTPQAWAADWINALEGAGFDVAIGSRIQASFGSLIPKTVQKAPVEYSFNIPSDIRIGVAIVAYGDPARKCARRLVKSLREHAPSLARAIISDEPLVDDVTEWIEHPDTDLGGRGPKTLLDSLVPQEWDIVIYLDADVVLVSGIDGLIAPLLDGWDWVICPNPARYALVEHGRRPDNHEELDATIEAIGSDQLLQYSGGVLAYRRSPATRALMAAWHQEWQRWGKRDQTALDRAIWANPVRIWMLSEDFNTSVRYGQQTARTAILHHQLEARRWKGIVTGRLDSPDALGRVRNSEFWAETHPSRDERMPSAPESR